MFTAIVAVRFLVDLSFGNVRDGSALNIILRIAGVAALLFGGSFIIAAVLDWYGRNLKAKG